MATSASPTVLPATQVGRAAGLTVLKAIGVRHDITSSRLNRVTAQYAVSDHAERFAHVLEARVAYAANWKFPNGVAPALSTAANAVDRLSYFVRSATHIDVDISKARA